MTLDEAISKWIVPAIKNTWNEKKCKEILEALEQEPKTGHWVYKKGYALYKWKCNQCSAVFKTDFNCCPNCGAKMVEPQESEVRDADID